MNFVRDFIVFAISLIKFVEARHCTYIYGTGHMKYFYCNSYEYCCGPMCCRAHGVTFYQMWYFWMIVLLTILLCSGGGWWYRFHNQGAFVNPTMITTGRPVMQTGPPGIPPGQTVLRTAQPYYPQQVAVHQQPIQQYPLPFQQPHMQQFQSNQAPPPYSDPPPSYAAAVNRTN